MAGLRGDVALDVPLVGSQFRIRWGRRSDCAEIMRLINELAEFEKAPAGSVSVTRGVLERDGFSSDSPLFRVLVVEETSEPEAEIATAVNVNDDLIASADTSAGANASADTSAEVDLTNKGGAVPLVAFALFFTAYSTWQGPFMYLEDLYVVPEHRGKGIGQCLLKNLARMCVDQGLPRLRWQVLDWNAPARAFYKSIGAAELSEWLTCQMGVDSLRQFCTVARIAKSD